MSKAKRTNIYMICLLTLGILFSLSYSVFKLPRSGLTYDFSEIIYPGLAVLLFFLITKENPRRVLQFHRLSVKNILYIALLTALFIPISAAISLLTQLIFPNQYLVNQMSAMGSGPLWYALIISAVIPAVLEEMSFRGIVRDGYGGFSLRKQAIIVGLFFGFFHLDFNQFFYAAAIGFFMAYVFYYTQSIISTMILHFLNNSLSVVVSHFVQGNSALQAAGNAPDTFSAGVMITAYVFLAVIVAVDCLLFRLAYRSFVKYNKKRRGGSEWEEIAENAEPEANPETNPVRNKLFTPTFFVVAGLFVLFAAFVQVYDNLYH